MDTITEEILAIEGDIIEKGYFIDDVLASNNIFDDEDMIMFALRYLLSNIDDALIDTYLEDIDRLDDGEQIA